MGLFSRIFRRKQQTPKLATLHTKPLRRLGVKNYEYKSMCEMEFEGKPIRLFEVTVKAPTAKMAEAKIIKGLKFKVKSTYKIKRAK